MEPFWEKGSPKSSLKKTSEKYKNPIVLNNQFSTNFLSEDGGINSMVEYGPVVYYSRKPETGVRFSYTAHYINISNK